ncbi:MAG: F0F1 ATP synthase subunit B [Bacteroidales bacterium]|nr:F0F1 ATP synthase subunit B [Bacteroidales bacterium]
MNNPLINPGPGTFVWMLVSFGILVFILAKWGWPMLLKSLKEREVAIDNALNAAEKAKEEMAHLQASNQDLLREAKKERDEMLRHARATSDQIIEDARAKAAEEIIRMREAALESIKNEKLRVMHDMKNQIAQFSIDIAEKLIRTELSDRQRADAFVKGELERIQKQYE